jgi:hypothetical protein
MKGVRAGWATWKDDIRVFSAIVGGLCSAFVGVFVAPSVDDAVPQAPDHHKSELCRGPLVRHWAAYLVDMSRTIAVYGGTVMTSLILGTIIMARPSFGVPVMFGVIPAAVALADRRQKK